jgi:replication factor C subunit 2/4
MDAVLGQDHIVTFLRERIADPPHIIMWGPTGVGKTMLANAWITEHLISQGVVSSSHQAAMILRLSSADDRGITAIRQRLTEFVRRVRPVAGAVAWVLLDDADNLPVVTQQALRRILELHAHQTRFVFIAQSPEHFIEPIQSRCVMLKGHPVDLTDHGRAILSREAPTIHLEDDAIRLMAGICNGNARQFSLICKAMLSSVGSSQEEGAHTISPELLQLLVNAPPVSLLLRLQEAIIARDVSTITECALSLWSKGYSFEDCIAMLETVVRIYNSSMTAELQYVLQCCAEGHVYQILNHMTTLDLIAVLSGQASGEALAEPLFADI